jgi:type I restriction-modification system DNA methylase subunit
MANQLFNEVLDITQGIWKAEPMRNIRMPDVNRSVQPINVDALWTDSGDLPDVGKLAFLIQFVAHERDLVRWKQRLAEWPIRGGLLVSPDETIHLVEPPSNSSQPLGYKVLSIDDWRKTLVSPKPHLFTPKALSKFRDGQLSFADLEEHIDKRSFSFISRQQQKIDKAFDKAIQAALENINTVQNPISSRNEVKKHIIRTAIAYLAARILEDKGFFRSDGIPQSNDILNLLQCMVDHTNGFFTEVLKSAKFVGINVRQQFALHMGPSVNFTLTNHRDVGRLYEKAVITLPDNLQDQKSEDLNRHYTPFKVSERILELLPLERIRPKERFIFDPAAGSGSLLLAATRRLSQMSDIDDNQASPREYLSNHVIGNDIDEDVKLITQLRYFLARESENNTDLLPSPQFYNENYESFNRDNISQKIGNKPRIIVANPPFKIIRDKQLAFEFVKRAISWLDEDSQFAFILPSSFISGSKYDAPDIRRLLSDTCTLFEIGRYPEGTIGIEAKHDVSIVIGQIGKAKNQIYTMSRSVISRAEAFEIRENGYLGTSHITEINSNGDWSNLITPKIKPSVQTIPLSALFFVFNGVTHKKDYPPVKECPEGKTCKPTWRMKWSTSNSVWADPLNTIDKDNRWVIYDKKSLHCAVGDLDSLFDIPKIFVGRISNIASNNSLSVQLDTTGFCPNNSIWCILPIQEARQQNKQYQPGKQPEDWDNLSFEQQRLWLLGILTSDIAAELSMSGRGTVNLTQDILLNFSLPLLIDQKIIDITDQMVKRDKNREPIPENDPLRQELNRLVEKSYGNPVFVKRQRTGKSPELEAWQNEQEHKKTLTVIGQVLDIDQDKNQVLLRLSGLLDDNEEEWLTLPQELPGWALNGTVFRAELSEDIETFAELAQRPWALRKFRHTPHPYLTNEELKIKLSRMIDKENQ